MPYVELNVLNNARRGPALGIDLGTTNSLAATMVDGRPRVLKPEGHSGRVPSAIAFPPDGEVVVGQAARDLALVHPERTIFSIKRLMGRGLADVREDLADLAFPVVENERGVLQVDVRGERWTPQQLSALILQRVQQIAHRALGGEEATRAVITVPAYFDEAQRQATRDAARLAGIDAMRILNEPTAASLAYGLDRKKQGTVAVYDLGGGTFDVSVLSIEDGVFQVLSTSGDTHLGGDDIDRALAALALDELRDRVDPETRDDPGFRQALRLAAEKCKMALSTKPEAEMHLIMPELGLNWRRRVTRKEFEALAAELVERTLASCRRALADAKLEASDIEEVVLVGGSTRIPLVRQRVEQFFGRAPHTELDPDEVVALGAAVQANVLDGGTRDVLLLDVTPLSLGLETMGGAVDKIIPRNSTIPCAATGGFTTYADDQTGIVFNVVQGERELASDCRSLGRFELKGIPPMPAGMPRVAVRFHIDADGLLTVSAKEEGTGAAAQIEIEPMNGLTDPEVEQMLKDSYEHAQADFDARHAADLKVEIGIMARATERNLPAAREHLDRETVRDLEESMAAAQEACKGDDVRALQAARDHFEHATLPLAALLMDDVAKKALAGKTLGEV